MKTNPHISIKEKRLLTILASTIFAITLINLGWIAIEDYNNSIKEKQEKLFHEANGTDVKLDFKIYVLGRSSYTPIFRFFALIMLPAFIWSRKYFVALILTFIACVLFVLENYIIFNLASINEVKLTFCEIINQIARPLDYLVFLLISILLFWQISILLRILVKLTQRKFKLP